MFNVKHNQSGKVRKAYAVCGTSFLLFDEEIGWFYEDISAYTPC